MTKDYEERVKSLSDQLDLLKQHELLKPGESSCSVENNQRIKEGSDHSKVKVCFCFQLYQV